MSGEERSGNSGDGGRNLGPGSMDPTQQVIRIPGKVGRPKLSFKTKVSLKV